MERRLLATHEVNYFIENAHLPPDDVRGLLSDEVSIWRMESKQLKYDWQLCTNPEFSRVWVTFKIDSIEKAINGEDHHSSSGLLISNSKQKYIYER